MKLLSVREVADFLGLGQTTVYKMIWEGNLPAVKIGKLWKIRMEDVENLIHRK